MTRHELKLWPDQFAATQQGIRRADVRRCDDRDFRRHDEVLYREHWGSSGKYSGRAILARVTHLVRWAGELELVGVEEVPTKNETIRLVKIVVLSIEVLEVGDYKKLKNTSPLPDAGGRVRTPGKEGQP